jgi:hypothetical protein
VLTVQQWQSRGGSFDFEPAEEVPLRQAAEEALGKGYG